MLNVILLLADNDQPDFLQGLMTSPLPIMVLIFVALYFIVLRPAKKREQMQRELFLTSLKKNDRVLTSGGIIGHIANINDKEEEVTLKLDESSNVRIRILKSAIIKNYTSEEAAREQAARDGKTGAAGKEEAVKAAKS